MSEWNKHYHWKTKGVTDWAKDYFTERFVGKSAEADGAEVRIDSLESWEGDVELGNRKGKLITIYDCSMSFAWSGKSSDGADAKGKIVFPEVSHDVHDDGEEYKMDTDLTSTPTSSSSSLLSLIRGRLAPQLLPHLHAFRNDLVATHAKDLGHDDAAAAAVRAGGKVVEPSVTTTTTTTTTGSGAATGGAEGAEAKEGGGKGGEADVDKAAKKGGEAQGQEPRVAPPSVPPRRSSSTAAVVAAVVALVAAVAGAVIAAASEGRPVRDAAAGTAA